MTRELDLLHVSLRVVPSCLHTTSSHESSLNLNTDDATSFDLKIGIQANACSDPRACCVSAGARGRGRLSDVSIDRAGSMASIAALNHGGRCVRELSEFDQLMGWSFRDYRSHAETADDELDLDAEYLASKHQELTRTAFDVPVRIPDDFVAPSHAQPSSTGKSKDTKKKKKKSLVQSHAYSKRATGPTASSAAKHTTQKSPGRQKTSESSRAHASSPVSHASSKRGPATNSELRALMDAERRELQRRAAAKEAELRAANRWVFDKRDVDQKPRKVAWHADASVSQRPSSPSRAKSIPGKTSIAPNVSDWRPQPRPSHPSRPDEREQWRRRERDRRVQQQRRAMTEDVAATIDAFEERMEQWTL